MFWLTFEVVQKAASGHKFIAKNPLISLRGITQESHKVWAVELMRNHSNFSTKFSLSLHRKPWQSLHCNWSSITELPYVHCSKSSSPYQCVCTEIRRCSRQFFQCEDLHWWSMVWQFCILHWWSTLWRCISTWQIKRTSGKYQKACELENWYQKAHKLENQYQKACELESWYQQPSKLENWYKKACKLGIGIRGLEALKLVYQNLGRLQFVYQKLGSFKLVFRNLEARWNWSQKLRSLKIYFRSLELVSEAEKLGICIRKPRILEPRNWCQKLGSLKLVYQKLKIYIRNLEHNTVQGESSWWGGVATTSEPASIHKIIILIIFFFVVLLEGRWRQKHFRDGIWGCYYLVHLLQVLVRKCYCRLLHTRSSKSCCADTTFE